MNIIYTVCNRTTLTNALALADSVSKYQPDDRFILGWADPLPLGNLPGNIEIITAAEIQIPFLTGDLFDFEILAACRPWFALALTDRFPACEHIVFLAPSTVLHRSFNELTAGRDSVFLTPNISKPLAVSGILDDKRILNIGMFHAGSWAMKPNAQTKAALQWWARRTHDRARFDLCNGMNLDQLWLNYVPVWVPDTVKLSNAGWHYGLHAVLNKKLTGVAGNYQVDSQPLYSTEFAGLTYFDPVWSDHIELAAVNTTFGQLLDQYQNALKSFASFVPQGQQPGYGKTPEVKKNRLFRNRMAKKLRGLTVYIDQF